jgi:AcrR family transcriptional regulator
MVRMMETSTARDLMMFPPHLGDDMSSIWLDFGDDPEPNNRQRLIYLTMREVAIVGPATFNTSGVCDTLGISYPMVNYYFGNRDGLIAEAAYTTYVRYLEKLWRAVEAAPRTPVDRLRAYLQAHLRLNVEISGWGAVLNYPIFSTTIAQILSERFGEDHRIHFELNMARLARLILDLWEDVVTQPIYRLDDYPREQLITQQLLMAATAMLSWGTLGVAVWRSGRHAPSQGIRELVEGELRLIDAYTDNLIRTVAQMRPS